MSQEAICPDCHKPFTKRKNLYQHQRNIHKKVPDLLRFPKNFTCDTCGVSFTAIQNLYRHKKNVHNVRVSCSQEKHECTACQESFRTQHTYVRHLQTVHNEETRSYIFYSKIDFEKWKCEEEEKCKALFSTRSCYKVCGNAKRTIFLCHRYGEFKSKSTGQRCLKVQGSTREGNHCTARMEVTEYRTGDLSVTYFPRHHGHLDNVNYVSKNDKMDTFWYISKKEDNIILERVSNRRAKKIKVSDISRYHSIAESMSVNLVFDSVGTDESFNLVKCENNPDVVYQVSYTSNPCFPKRPDKKCSYNCPQCNICIHEYKCTCDDWAENGGVMCKHIHLVAISKKRENYVDTINDDSVFLEIELECDELDTT